MRELTPRYHAQPSCRPYSKRRMLPTFLRAPQTPLSTTSINSLQQKSFKLSASADDSAEAGNNLPITPVQMTDQAAVAVSAALSAGILRQQIDFLLPINEKEKRFTATEPDDYPCSLQREFDVVAALTTALLQRVLGDSNVQIVAKRLDEGGVEGEPCAVLYPAETKSIAAVVYPTADRLNQIKALAKDTSRPLLLVNPQWREEGQVISDFGIGPWKKAALDFLSQFNPTYFLKEKRIGSPGTINGVTGTRFTSGGVLRVLRQWETEESPYEVYAMSANGSSQLLGKKDYEPKYQELDSMITDGRLRKLEIFEIAKKATYVFANDDDEEQYEDDPDLEERSPPGDILSDADIEALDAASVRRLLLSYGAPASGKLSKLKERLKEAQMAGSK